MSRLTKNHVKNLHKVQLRNCTGKKAKDLRFKHVRHAHERKETQSKSIPCLKNSMRGTHIIMHHAAHQLKVPSKMTTSSVR